MKKIVYIAHPISGDMEGNIKRVLAIYRELSIQNEVIPFAPYLVALQVLNDTVQAERKIGMLQNRAFFERNMIDELWVCGLSAGVVQEMMWASEYGIKIVSKL